MLAIFLMTMEAPRVRREKCSHGMARHEAKQIAIAFSVSVRQ